MKAVVQDWEDTVAKEGDIKRNWGIGDSVWQSSEVVRCMVRLKRRLRRKVYREIGSGREVNGVQKSRNWYTQEENIE